MNNIETREYGTQEIADILGETIHKTISYITRGYVKPSIQDASGHGTRRLWSYTDVVRCLLVQRLLKSGFSVERVRDLSANAMRDEYLQKHIAWKLYETGGQNRDGLVIVYVQDKGGEEPSKGILVPLTDDDFREFPDVHVVSIKALHDIARERIAKIL